MNALVRRMQTQSSNPRVSAEVVLFLLYLRGGCAVPGIPGQSKRSQAGSPLSHRTALSLILRPGLRTVPSPFLPLLLGFLGHDVCPSYMIRSRSEVELALRIRQASAKRIRISPILRQLNDLYCRQQKNPATGGARRGVHERQSFRHIAGRRWQSIRAQIVCR